MLIDIHNFSRLVGLNTHLAKTKVMLNNHTNKATFAIDGRLSKM